jgi:3-methyladenine DNA glycosylase AlkD
MRMRNLFDTAKAATWIAPDELETLFAEPSYEARMAAFCILDFQARKRLGDLGLLDTYVRHHDRIDDWGMVDRAAPRVIGAALAGGPYDLLHELAASPDPYRRRTAMTAPLWFVKYGDHADVEAGIAIAEVLHTDADPLVHKPVGIYLPYAGDRLPERLTEFLDEHGEAMPRAAYRIAIRKRRTADDGRTSCAPARECYLDAVCVESEKAGARRKLPSRGDTHPPWPGTQLRQ